MEFWRSVALPITLQSPLPPHFRDPTFFIIEMLIGFAVLLGVTVLVDKLGTAMFHRGFAKPFYVRGRRIHHNIIYLVLPICYGAISVLYFLGFVTPIWSELWTNLGYVVIITTICLLVDFLGDKFWPDIRKNVILHHEWIYSVIPAFVFASMFVIRV